MWVRARCLPGAYRRLSYAIILMPAQNGILWAEEESTAALATPGVFTHRGFQLRDDPLEFIHQPIWLTAPELS